LDDVRIEYEIATDQGALLEKQLQKVAVVREREAVQRSAPRGLCVQLYTVSPAAR
jgi:hypothetical protein